VYLLHFSEPYQHAQHYAGWTADLDARVAEHQNGTGAKLTSAAARAGVTFAVAVTWPGTRDDEGRLKKPRGSGKTGSRTSLRAVCPTCGGSGKLPTPRHPKPDTAPPFA
jgi:predicted GIY-YIG superfamily endonuclease